MSCQSCASKFNLFKKKKACFYCQQSFCRNCVREADRKIKCTNMPNKTMRLQVCSQCYIMSMPSVTYAQLIKLDTRYMRLFLMNRKISLTGYHEKSELVQLVLNYNTDVYTGGSSSSSSSSSSRPFSDMLARQNSFIQPENTQQTSRASSTTTNEDQTQPQLQHQTWHTSAQLEEQPQQQTGDENPIEDRMELEASTEITTEEARSSFKRINSLSELHSVDDIDKMTTKDMKIVLTRNFVNYTGCFEKGELKKKLVALYESNKQMETRLRNNEENSSSTNDLAIDNTSGISKQRRIDDELCKICMDRLIDCVLIECGHMCSCVKCGKLLSECPICRQYVIRCIRVFKS